jgi:hypothetical protein
LHQVLATLGSPGSISREEPSPGQENPRGQEKIEGGAQRRGRGEIHQGPTRLATPSSPGTGVLPSSRAPPHRPWSLSRDKGGLALCGLGPWKVTRPPYLHPREPCPLESRPASRRFRPPNSGQGTPKGSKTKRYPPKRLILWLVGGWLPLTTLPPSYISVSKPP